MKLLHWQGFYFTVSGGTPYIVQLRPQLHRIKNADTEQAVLKQWDIMLENERKASEWSKKHDSAEDGAEE